MARYKITITETKTETKKIGKEWCQGADPENGDSGWGYSPEIEKDIDVQRKILEQEIDDIDIKTVIKAINGL